MVKASSDEMPGTLTALVSAKNNVDRVGDKIVDGAYKFLDETINDGFGAVGHNWSDSPIMTIESAKETADGLEMEMMFHSTKEAQDARTVVIERLARKKSVSMSIGYETLKFSFQEVDGKQIRLLEEIKIYEASIVTVPANPLAKVSGAKSLLLDGMTLEQQIEALLDGAGDLKSRMSSLADDRGYISQVRRDALKTLIDSLNDLYEQFTPEVKKDEVFDLLHARHLELRHAGII